MKRSQVLTAGWIAAAVCMVGLLVFSGAACKKEQEQAGGGQKDAKVVYVNDRCPIMGNAISAGVSEDLTREHNGKKVAFCCSSCPPAWDKLTAAQKDEKLEKVLAKE